MKSDFEHLKDLIENYFIKDLEDEELTALQDGLELHPELRDYFMDTASDEWLLHHMYRTGAKIIPLHNRQTRRKSIQRIAAATVILLSIGTMFTAQRISLKNTVATPKKPYPIATVLNCFVLEDDAISAVNQGELRQVTKSSPLRTGDYVVIPPGSHLTFQYNNENTIVNMGGNSFFSLTDRNGAKHIQLRQGRMQANVSKQPPQKPMRITTSDAEAVVLGTSFELLASDITRLTVSEGCVRLNSPDEKHSVDVEAGCLADADSSKPWESYPFRIKSFTPILDLTYGQAKEIPFISVDNKREYSAYLKFDIGEQKTPLLEAKLRLRVMSQGTNHHGHGTIRLFFLQNSEIANNQPPDQRTQIAYYAGNVGNGMDLEFDIDPANISSGTNTLLITQDEGGNDFWFSSSEGPTPPRLNIKTKAH